MNKPSPVFHEDERPEKEMPGRRLRWLVKPELTGNANCAVNMVRLAPGATVSPAHSHDDEEEVIYIVDGEGAVLIDGKVYPLRAGSMAVFAPRSVHMLRNSGSREMKVVCFFSPATDTSKYRFHEGVSFPS